MAKHMDSFIRSSYLILQENRMIAQDAIKMLDAVIKVMILTDPIILLSSFH